MPTHNLIRRLAVITASLASAICLNAAIAWRDVQIGGFVSQGFVASSANDYLGSTSDGTFDFREYAANASWSKGKFRLGAQIFGQKLGTYGDDKIRLDWATLDYQPAQWLGFRAGRVKMPRGLYNEALDLDSVRPFVLLPQSVYDPRLRDFNASFDGVMAYGNISARKFGSLDYKLFYGDIPMVLESGAVDYFNTTRPLPTFTMGMKSARGGSLFWNTPLQGLRLGYSYSEYRQLASIRDGGPVLGGLHNKFAEKFPRNIYSAEYVRGDWTFAVEHSTDVGNYIADYINIVRRTPVRSVNSAYYVAASRRINGWLEIGAYYDNYREENGTTTRTIRRQIDHALSFRFDINDRLLFKLEGHYYDGAGKIFDTIAHRQPQAALDQSWTMLAAKTTYSF